MELRGRKQLLLNRAMLNATPMMTTRTGVIFFEIAGLNSQAV
jgi:hypothetical protein